MPIMFVELNDEEHNSVQFKDGSTKTGAVKNQSRQASISVMSLQLIIPKMAHMTS